MTSFVIANANGIHPTLLVGLLLLLCLRWSRVVLGRRGERWGAFFVEVD